MVHPTGSGDQDDRNSEESSLSSRKRVKRMTTRWAVRINIDNEKEHNEECAKAWAGQGVPEGHVWYGHPVRRPPVTVEGGVDVGAIDDIKDKSVDYLIEIMEELFTHLVDVMEKNEKRESALGRWKKWGKPLRSPKFTTGGSKNR